MTKQGTVSQGNTSGKGELRARLLFVLLAIFIYRIGTHIPVPGINNAEFAKTFENLQILEMFNSFSGGALERMSLFALGIIPYISASIIMQLLTVAVPYLEQLKKEGEAGRRKITQFTRYGTLLLASVQAFFIAAGFAGSPGTEGTSLIYLNANGEVPLAFYIGAVTTLTCGTMFLMWLGEQITERGIGNGISILIFAGIVSSLPGAMVSLFNAANPAEGGSSMELWQVAFVAVFALAVVAFIVFMERGQRKITINYAKRQQGRQMMAAQTSHLPIKVNMAGVIPAIFASSLLLFPQAMGGFAGEKTGGVWDVLNTISKLLQVNTPLYYIVFGGAVIFFCYFYTAVTFNPKDVAENLKRSGAFIPGIRPGEQTSRYIDGVSARLTFFGALYIAAVSLFPQSIVSGMNAPFFFGGMSLLIVVVVVMDFVGQVQSHLMSSQYASLMKKSNQKGDGGAGLFR
ncbi:preprotein translocase subunit SecY [Marinicellulosiphila megalodicopiae]|uniref:preprotein translocase subunit SecY n=1 Tax=Marinicellulosiphila megalodicopiae TaxID=2724896 RepID=UPI003BAFDFAB